MLDRDIVIQALKTPYKRVLDFAMTYVSLSDKEKSCVFLCIVDDITEEKVAEQLKVSREYVSKHKKRGIEKLQKAWEFCELIPILTMHE